MYIRTFIHTYVYAIIHVYTYFQYITLLYLTVKVMYACVYLTVRVEDMMKRSFAELDSARHEVDRQQALKDLEQSIGSLEDLDCPLCSTDVDHYYSACARIAHLRKEMQVEPLLYVIDIVTEWCFDGSSFCNDGCS